MRILVVDDDTRGAALIVEILRRAGYTVEFAGSGGAALAAVSSHPPDLMILDYELPDFDAPELFDQLRAGRSGLPFPVIVLSGARPAPSDQVLTLDRGAVDYLVKGVDRQVMLAKVRVALRERRPSVVVGRGKLRVERDEGRAWLAGRELYMGRKPVEVLFQLALREGTAVSRQELLHEVWRTDFRGFDHSVDQAVYAIRKALGDPRWVETVRGHGYRLVARG
ncbi:MAG: response regulator transcription factor [Candidatus Dormibacteraceae bacterium]